MSKMNREDYGVYPPRRRISIVMQHGVSFGAALAMAISFNINHSVLWAIVHGLFSWLYVVYCPTLGEKPRTCSASFQHKF